MKTEEELAALKAELEALNEKLAELTEEELKAVAGGYGHNPSRFCPFGSDCTKNPADCYSHKGNKPDSPYYCPKI